MIFSKINTNIYNLIAPFLAFIFGLSLIFSVLSAGDGTWFLYAREALSHKGIYSDLKLTAQPIFPLLNILSLYIFGSTFLAQKIIFVLILGLYVHSLYLLVNLINLNLFFRSIIYLTSFFIGIHFEAFRFDDYHALSNALFMYSIYFGYSYLSHDNSRYLIIFSLLSSLTFLTRVNQGLAVIFSFGCLIIFSRQSIICKAKNIFLTIILSSIISLLIVTLTFESLFTWFDSTIYTASSAKGSGNIFFYPYNLLINSFSYLYQQLTNNYYWNFIILLCLFIACSLSIKNRLYYFITSLFLTFCIFNVYASRDIIIEATPIVLIISFCIFLILIIGEIFFNVHNIFKIFYFPFFLFFFASLSSGGYFYGMYFEVSIFIIVFLIVFSKLYEINFYILLIYLCSLGFFGFSYRLNNPYSWHSYHVHPLFSKNYKFINSDNLGPHLITTDLLNHISPVCSAVSSEGSLLSLPFSFANYYCGLPVWKGYVQTFFDTSTKSTISNLIKDLENNPPDFIFYQRQLDNLRGHEVIFNGGNPLPHRYLDAFIMDNIKNSNWRVVYESSYAQPSHWLLISTKK